MMLGFYVTYKYGELLCGLSRQVDALQINVLIRFHSYASLCQSRIIAQPKKVILPRFKERGTVNICVL